MLLIMQEYDVCSWVTDDADIQSKEEKWRIIQAGKQFATPFEMPKFLANM